MYIAIEGVIGVGKTTLARLLQPAFNAQLLLEVFEENPFLADFYSDRERYAFQTQIFFLLSRYHQQRAVPKLLSNGGHLLSDYTFEKDCLFAGINLDGDEFDVYFEVHQALAEKIPPPNLIVYLKASTEILIQRIAHRDRTYERNMEWGYIDQLNHGYDDFFGDRHNGPAVLVIDTNTLNYIANPEDLKWVENRIRQSLKMTPFQSELPLEIGRAD
jgi:deoxyguanosine kinase